MIATLLCTAVLAPSKDPSSEAMITAMVRKYAGATVLAGSIDGAVSDGTGTISTLTSFKYARPSRLSVVQNKLGMNGGTFRILSDGKKFSYEEPLDKVLRTGKRLYEPIRQRGYLLTVPDIYMVGYKGMPDPGIALEVALGVQSFVKDWRKLMARIDPPEKTNFKGESAYTIKGTIRETFAGPANANFELTISESKELKRYLHVIAYEVNGKVVRLATVYDLTADLNATLSPTDFAVE